MPVKKPPVFIGTADNSTWLEKAACWKLLGERKQETISLRLVLHLFLTDVINRVVDADTESQQLFERKSVRALR